MKFVPGCCHCGGCGPATVDATALCCGTGSPLTGFTFDLRDSGDTTTLATQTGSSASFTGLDGTLSYKVRVSKTGYHTKTSGTLTPGCGGTSTTAVSTWPTTYSLSNHVQLNGLGGPCSLSGVTVAYTGDGSDSDTTDGSGNATSSLSSSSSTCMQSLNYTITPPSGHGAAVKTGTISVNPCAPASQTYTLDPSAGHVAFICNTRYMPEDLDWVDDFGACTVSYGAGIWTGSYTYTSNHCFNEYECDFVGPNPFAELSGSVTVGCYLDGTVTGTHDCTSAVFNARRLLYLSAGVSCYTLGAATYHCQPMADGLLDDWPFLDYEELSLTNAATTISETCGTSVSLTLDIAAYPVSIEGAECDEYEETAVTVDVTGTIT